MREDVRKRKAKGDQNLQELTKKVKNARKLLSLRKSPFYKDLSSQQRALLSPFFDKATSINSAWKASAVIGHHILSAETFEDLPHNRALEGDLINYWQ